MIGRDDRFDFDYWKDLAMRDPAAFERQRAAALEAVIGTAPEPQRRRLAGLQWRVECVRAQSRTPLAACVRMSRMMWDSVLGHGGLMDQLDRLERPEARQQAPAAGVVLDLRAGKRSRDGSDTENPEASPES